MALRTAPVRRERPAGHAVRMALAMRDAFPPLAETWKKRGYELGLGCGVAQGYATLGAIGFEGRWDYAAIGNVTNLAARLCSEAGAGVVLVDRKIMAAVDGVVDAEAAVREMARVLKPGGRLLLVYPAEPIRGLYSMPGAWLGFGNPFLARQLHVPQFSRRRFAHIPPRLCLLAAHRPRAAFVRPAGGPVAGRAGIGAPVEVVAPEGHAALAPAPGAVRVDQPRLTQGRDQMLNVPVHVTDDTVPTQLSSPRRAETDTPDTQRLPPARCLSNNCP